MNQAENISFIVAFISGLFIFLSPCILPLFPSYISYLTGVSFSELSADLINERKKEIRMLTIVHSLMFIVGFSIVFISLGATVTFLGRLFLNFKLILEKVGGLLIIFFGLMIAGVFRIKAFEKERKITYKKKSISYLGSAVVGATFALAWMPCVGPILGSILVYASSTASVKLGIWLLSAFSLGLAVPFFISSLLASSFLLYFKKINKYIRWINLAAGVILILFGIIILTGRLR